MEGLIKLLFQHPRMLDEFPPEYVADKQRFVIVSFMEAIHRKGIQVTPEIIRHELKEAGHVAILDALNEALEEETSFQPDYVVPVLREDYNKRIEWTLLNEAMRMHANSSSAEIERFVSDGLRAVKSANKPKNTVEALSDTMKYLTDMQNGLVLSTWRTGLPIHDAEAAFAKRMLVMIAAQQKQGKTRKAVDYIMRLLQNQPDIKVDWFSFEMHANEMIICLIAWITGISTSVIKGRSRKPTPEEWKQIVATKSIVEKLPITWHDEKMGIDGIRRQVEQNMTDNHIVVIDNLGLIKNDRNLDDLRFDNEVASTLVDMRDKTGALIFLLHHLSKESESHFNKQDGYEPQTKHIRGSNKWADCLNMLILLHRVSAYDQLKKVLGYNDQEWEEKQHSILVKIPITRDGVPLRIKMKHKLECCQFEEQDMQDATAA